ncbi:hypothetical protein ABTH43_19715, partial [Acinetobacter baumannii]
LTVVLLPAAWAILPGAGPATANRPASASSTASPGTVGQLFGPALRLRTIVLWCAVFFGLMVLYFIVSWIPKLSIAAGLSETNGI